jgi:hypothetical protein
MGEWRYSSSILDSIRWNWVVSYTPLRLYCWGRSRVSYWLGGLQRRCRLCRVPVAHAGNRTSAVQPVTILTSISFLGVQKVQAEATTVVSFAAINRITLFFTLFWNVYSFYIAPNAVVTSSSYLGGIKFEFVFIGRLPWVVRVNRYRKTHRQYLNNGFHIFPVNCSPSPCHSPLYSPRTWQSTCK